MIDVVNNASRLMADVPAQMLPALFSSLTAKDNAGLKLIALILVRVRPNLKFYSFVKRSLNTRNSNSWFEHYHAIMAAGRLAALGNKKVKSEVIVILEKLLPALGVDHDRLVLAKDILSGLKESPGSTQDSSAVSA
jgi:hypothetical protein